MTDTKAELAKAREFKDRLNTAGLAQEMYGAASVVGRLADALERQQGVVEALRQIKAHEGKVCPQYETCQHESCASSYAAWVIADMALAALDAPQEGDGTKERNDES